jgi:hypothetical protein
MGDRPQPDLFISHARRNNDQAHVQGCNGFFPSYSIQAAEKNIEGIRRGSAPGNQGRDQA